MGHNKKQRPRIWGMLPCCYFFFLKKKNVVSLSMVMFLLMTWFT